MMLPYALRRNFDILFTSGHAYIYTFLINIMNNNNLAKIVFNKKKYNYNDTILITFMATLPIIFDIYNRKLQRVEREMSLLLLMFSLLMLLMLSIS